MPKRKRPEPDEKRERPRRHRDGRDRPVIVEIVRRRLEGGAPPTPEAYSRALEQWQKLGGAVVRVSSTITSPQEPQKPSESSTSAPTEGSPNDKPRQ
jgi:hypothetical protein